MLLKLFKSMEDLEEKIGKHYIKVFSSEIGLSVYIVREKDLKFVRRTFSEQELTDAVSESALFKIFVEDAVNFINLEGI